MQLHCHLEDIDRVDPISSLHKLARKNLHPVPHMQRTDTSAQMHRLTHTTPPRFIHPPTRMYEHTCTHLANSNNAVGSSHSALKDVERRAINSCPTREFPCECPIPAHAHTQAISNATDFIKLMSFAFYFARAHTHMPAPHRWADART